MQWETGMQCLIDDLRLLEAAQGYATLGLHLRASQELEQMSRETRLWPEVLSVKLAIFDSLKLWDMVEIIVMQLGESARDNPQWMAMAEMGRRRLHTARQRERTGGLLATAG